MLKRVSDIDTVTPGFNVDQLLSQVPSVQHPSVGTFGTQRVEDPRFAVRTYPIVGPGAIGV